MESIEGLLRTLHHGSKEEKGQVLASLSLLKDPSAKSALKEVMKSGDPYLSVMAAYALGESGDQSGFKYFEQLLGNSSNSPVVPKELFDFNLIEEILKFHQDLNYTLDSYNSSYFIEAREKLINMLDIFSSDPPKMNVPHFDEILSNLVYGKLIQAAA